MLKELGYACGDRLLIINADDFGMCHSTNEAIRRLLFEGAISSTSLMVTCPWMLEAAFIARRHQEFDIGIHLTFTSEWESYKWGPVNRTGLDTLVDEWGHFPANPRVVQQNASFEQVRQEVFAQIEFGLTLGIHPTHLDNHMGTLYGEFLDILMEACVTYDLPLRLPRNPQSFINQPSHKDVVQRAESKGIVLPDYLVGLPFALEAGETYSSAKRHAIEMLRGLQPGVTELIFHPSLDTEELKAITNTWQVRRFEFDLFRDEEIQNAIQRENIQIITWRDLRDLQRKRFSRE